MNKCKRVGIDITKRCNWKCTTCFYRYNPSFNSQYDVPMKEVMRQAEEAKNRGCNHVVFIGWGETSLYSELIETIKEIRNIDMTVSMITNGTMSPSRGEKIYAAGLDHFHVSVHGLGNTLDKISGIEGSSSQQNIFKQWLKSNSIPWRSNTTLQLLNYQELPYIIDNIIDHGAFHVVLLGFLPHYEWKNRLQEVAVNPATLRPFVETASENVLKNNRLLTIRYHPHCHIKESLYPYITNARYVLYDPWEWEYGHCGENEDTFKRSAIELGNSVSNISVNPCKSCDMNMHCGGWNKTYIDGFSGAGLKAIRKDTLSFWSGEFGAFHKLNPANSMNGIAP